MYLTETADLRFQPMARCHHRTAAFVVDPDSLTLIRDDIGIGVVHELRPEDAALLAPHLGVRTDTIFVAASGIDISHGEGTLLAPGRAVAIEWLRHESRPRSGEPEINVYRYLFGLTADGRCIGIQAWEPRSTADNDQVGDHWMTLDDVCRRYLDD